MTEATEGPSGETGDPTFISTLKEGHQRFLAHAIEHSFVCGRRSAEDFIRHFPPTAIMKGLEHQPTLRAGILVLTTGLKQKIALKKSWEDAATDLQIALDEGETDPDSIVALFNADDRVRYLPADKIWSFLIEGDFWKASTLNKTQGDVARNHIAFMLERALEDKLMIHRDVVEGIGVDELATRLPKAELGRIIQCALENADRGVPFTQTDLLATTPPRVLVQYVPLPHLWESVIVPKIAERHGYAPAPPKPIATAIEEAFAADSEPATSKRSASKKEASVVKLKQPAVPEPPLPKDAKDGQPGVRKASGSDEPGDEYSEIDILEDEAGVS